AQFSKSTPRKDDPPKEKEEEGPLKPPQHPPGSIRLTPYAGCVLRIKYHFDLLRARPTHNRFLKALGIEHFKNAKLKQTKCRSDDHRRAREIEKSCKEAFGSSSASHNPPCDVYRKSTQCDVHHSKDGYRAEFGP